jgi:glucokinase
LGGKIVAVDLGATKILTGIATKAGDILETVKIMTRSERSAGDIIADISSSVEYIINKSGTDYSQIDAVGICVPGPISYPELVIHDSPNLKWNRVEIKRELEARIKKPLIVEKDANMAAWGEFFFGQNQRYRHLLYITVSTGVGCGLILDGQIYRGSMGGAGEFGHIVVDPSGPFCACGRQGCLEAIVSGRAIAKKAQSLSDRTGALAGSPGAREVGMAAEQGDSLAQAIVDEVIYFLGIGIANLVNLLNPEIVVLGGGVALGYQRLIERPLREQVEKNVFPMHREKLKLEFTGLGDNVGLYGCVAAVLQTDRGKKLEYKPYT